MSRLTDEPEEKRLKILNKEELEDLYGLPHFTEDEQVLYFSLTPAEKAAIEGLHQRSRLYCILAMGYFKARHQFFIFHMRDVKEDARYVRETYLPKLKPALFAIGRGTRLKHQGLIMKLHGYQYCDDSARRDLTLKAQQVARLSSKPIFIFGELMQYLTDRCLILPGYTFMQDTVGDAISMEEERLNGLALRYLSDEDRTAVRELLTNPRGMYELTQLKREPKDFSETEALVEISKREQMRSLYELAERVLPLLEISNESIKHYASLVVYYTIFRLSRLDENLVDVYLLSFIHHRYQKLHDNLINCFLHLVKHYREEAKQAAKEKVYAFRVAFNRNVKKAGQVLKLFTDDQIDPKTPFETVQTQAFTILERKSLAKVAASLVGKLTFDEKAFQWEHLDEISRQFKRRLRVLLRTIEFVIRPADGSLLEAVQFLRGVFQEKKTLRQEPSEDFPMVWIPDSMRPYLYSQEKTFQADRYEFLLYRRLSHGLESGSISCRNSLRFRRLEDDLLSDERWQDKDALIAQTGLTLLSMPIKDHLAALREQLETRIVQVNERIASGENKEIQIKDQGRWTLPYSRDSESVNHAFFDGVQQVELYTVMNFVNQQCGFMNGFEPVLARYTKQSADVRQICACLIAWGTNMGLRRMASISDIDFHTLSTTSDNFIRLETLRQANDLISNAIAELPIFHVYDIQEGIVHSSSDGQKFETLIHTLNSRHSPKYFGLKKGIVSYTLVANHVPVTARIIGANEHESHYVFDVVYNNTTEIVPSVHSTDTHGTNQVNFAILHIFDRQFAPRYKDIYEKVRTSLYGFQHPSHYSDLLLKPIRKINELLIIDDWDNIQRIMVSLALKSTTQSIIIGKLNSSTRRNKTRQALWEYDNIIQSLYLLNYVDSLPLRRNVHRALNRGESFHQLKRAVSYANFGKLRFTTEYDQQIWDECSRLIANCIIFYNASILSSVLLLNQQNGDLDPAVLLRHISPVAWQHINFYGRFEFATLPAPIDINAIVQGLMLPPIHPESIG